MEQAESREALLKIVRDLFAKLSGEKQDRILEFLSLSLRNHLVNAYLLAVDEVKKNRKLSKQDKLKRLLSPIVDLNKINHPLGENPYRRNSSSGESFYPFISESIYLERELDLENLHADPSKYRIEIEEGEYLDPGAPSIFFRSEFEKYLANRERFRIKGDEPPPVRLDAGYLSLRRDIWEKWLPSLTRETIKSKDLLAQVLVAYTIKRALNGDEKAIEKLYDLYENTAQAIAVKTVRRLGVMWEVEDLKQDTRILLKFLLSGFQPEYIIKSLLEDTGDRDLMTLPRWVLDFYIHYFGKYVPQQIRDLLKEAEENERLIKFAEGLSTGKLSIKHLGKKDKETINWLRDVKTTTWLRRRNAIIGLELTVLFSPYTPIGRDTLWKNSPKLVRRFNNYSYRPYKMGPRRNLTIWLFGPRDKFQYGKLFQLLRDKYRPTVKQKRKDWFLNIEDIPSPERDDNWMEKSPHEIVARLVQLGVSERDAHIFTNWKFQRMSQAQIARISNLSERQIRNICRKVETFMPAQ